AALMAETGSAGVWSPTLLPLPAGGSLGFPFTYGPEVGVSCMAPASCLAVGADQTGAGEGAVAETSSDGVWSASALPAPTGGTSPAPQAVSCAGPQNCLAVGADAAGAGAEQALAETWAGGSWSASTLPVPAALPDAVLTALACPSSATCVAVGDDDGAGGAQMPVAETEQGDAWTSTVLPLPAGSVASGDADPELAGLSCPTSTACVAVGYAPGAALTEHPMVETRSGTTWRARRLPLPRGEHRQSAALAAISCVSATSCVAVGSLRSEAHGLVETLADGTWTATALAPPAGSPRRALSGVSCSTATSCVAVGAYWGTDPGLSRPLAATLAGTSWKVAALPVPGSARRNVAFTVPSLRAVSCPTAGTCVAAGFLPTGFDTTVPMVETLSAGRWRASIPPAPPAANWTLLWGVSCPGAGSCAAVGEADGAPLVEVLANGAWTPQSVALPPRATTGALLAVACGPLPPCSAAGAVAGVSGVLPLVASD
ncbi:MAG: hypothetical protein ACRDY1_10415, partial [Acidimicrobiales bacterium]